MYSITKRVFDFFLALLLLLVLSIPLLGLGLLVKLTSKGPVLYWSDRVGRGNRIFSMPKFRSMRTDTPTVATHLLDNPSSFITPLGRFLRKTSLDELPQLWSILKGDMSFVGPRPALYNQEDLILMRTEFGIDALRPGLTGWAQINGRDELGIVEKVALDKVYMDRMAFGFDLHIMWMTLFRVFAAQDVSH